MSDRPENPPAFPLKNYTKEVGPDTAGFTAKDVYGNSFWVNSGAPGMSLRDYFAAKVMPTILSDIDSRAIDDCAEDAYGVADAMLRARERAK